MPQRGKPKDFKERVYKVFKHDEYKTGGSELRVMAWIMDGKELPARLERRDYYITENGERRNGKCKGFTYEDVSFVMQNGDEIQNIMVGIKDQPKQEPPKTEDDDLFKSDKENAEVPF